MTPSEEMREWDDLPEGRTLIDYNGLVTVQTKRHHIASLLKQTIIRRYTGLIDDAGCDWATDGKGNTYFQFDPPLRISEDPLCATLVDAYYILTCGSPEKIEEPTEAERAR